MEIAFRNAMLADDEGASAYWGLCFTAEEAGSTVAMTKGGYAPTLNLLTSTDGVTWTPFVPGTTVITLASVGDKVYFSAGKGGNTKTASGIRYNYYANYFVLTGRVAASGDVTSLLNGTIPVSALTEYCTFAYLFYQCTSLTTAPALPATTLAGNDYYCMFQGCTSLTSAPELPATTLRGNCYRGMFSACTSLTSAPELPATTLASYCYELMFSACTSLISAPALPATTLVQWCYNAMFYGCTSLTSAPELPATTLAQWCYHCMFQDCTSLTSAPALPATSLITYCYESMFVNCTSLTSAPELPATNLLTKCYYRMFHGCSSLTKITVNFNDWKLPTEATTDWVANVNSIGTFYCPSDLSVVYTTSNIPNGWEVVNT